MVEHILIQTPDNLNGLSKEEVKIELIKKLQGRIEEAWLFGSFLTEDFSRRSDIDLILVKNTKLPFVERGLEFSDLRDWLPTIELLVYTPEEFLKLTSIPTPGFWRSVTKTMQKII